MTWEAPAHGGDYQDTATMGGEFEQQGYHDYNNGGQDAISSGTCHNCNQEGHLARECPEPRKMGTCYNCGEEGHNKAECPLPKKFKGECRTCGKEGHAASECPDKLCRNCNEPGHEPQDCKNPKAIDRSNIPDKTEAEAWDMLKQASDERDIPDFKAAVQILSKAVPELTYPALEEQLRNRNFSIYIIALTKDTGDLFTNVNLQNEIGQKYTVSYFYNDKPLRPILQDRWPKDPEDNLERLAKAGVPMDRGVDKCRNCDQIGHNTRNCAEEKAMVDRPIVKCALCDEEGHRVRDCTQERRQPGAKRTCKICDSEDHMAKDCPNREKRACRNCGSEEHMAKECPEPRNPATIQCHNCDEMGHTSRDCTAPRDWTRVTCKNCGEKGHGAKRCKEPVKEDENADLGGDSTAIEPYSSISNGNGISGHQDWENQNNEEEFAPVVSSVW